MFNYQYDLKFITPCISSAADQTEFDLRPTEIKAQLRWWFRAMGGSYEDEKMIFGGIGGENEKPSSSIFTIRISKIRFSPWIPPKLDPNSLKGYMWYYASVSNDKQRWTQNAIAAPDSTFHLSIIQKRVCPDSCKAFSLFESALDAFIAFGSLGLRSSRTMGAFYDESTNEDYYNKVRKNLEQHHFCFLDFEGAYSDIDGVISRAGSILKNLRKQFSYKGNTPSPFGFSDEKTHARQRSAIIFRPIFFNKKIHLAIFEAPHHRVLGDKSTDGGDTPLLKLYHL